MAQNSIDTVSTQSLMISCVIDAMENDLAIIEILLILCNGIIYVKLEGAIALLKVDLQGINAS